MTSRNDTVLAKCMSGLVIGSTAEDARVLASLETLTLDPDEQVPELAAQAIRKISRVETLKDAPR